MGAVLREQNALPCGVRIKISLLAKDDVNNVGAGRAAKGASPASSSKIKQPILLVVLFFLLIANTPHKKAIGTPDRFYFYSLN